MYMCLVRSGVGREGGDWIGYGVVYYISHFPTHPWKPAPLFIMIIYIYQGILLHLYYLPSNKLIIVFHNVHLDSCIRLCSLSKWPPCFSSRLPLCPF